jgi:hypothetical protein
VVQALFADGSTKDVTAAATFALDKPVADRHQRVPRAGRGRRRDPDRRVRAFTAKVRSR